MNCSFCGGETERNRFHQGGWVCPNCWTLEKSECGLCYWIGKGVGWMPVPKDTLLVVKEMREE